MLVSMRMCIMINRIRFVRCRNHRALEFQLEKNVFGLRIRRVSGLKFKENSICSWCGNLSVKLKLATVVSETNPHKMFASIILHSQCVSQDVGAVLQLSYIISKYFPYIEFLTRKILLFFKLEIYHCSESAYIYFLIAKQIFPNILFI